MTIRKAFGSISVVWTGMILGAGLSFMSQALLARALSLSDYGLLSAINNFLIVIAPLAGLGAGNYWLNKYGQYGSNGRIWVLATFKLMCFSIPIGIIFTIAIGFMFWSDQLARGLLIFLAPSILMQAFNNAASARFQLEERFGVLAKWRLLPILARFLIILTVYILGFGVLELASALSLSYLILGVLGVYHVHRLMTGRVNLVGHDAKQNTKQPVEYSEGRFKLLGVFRELSPFAIGSFFGLIYMQSDIFILSILSGNEQAGLYNAAFAVMAAIYLLPMAIFNQYLLPKYHRWSVYNKERMLKVFRFGNASMILTGLFVMVAVIVVAPFFIPTAFGPKYSETIKILSWLSICIPIRFLASSVEGCLATRDNMKRKVIFQGITAILNIILNVILIPLYHAYGAIMSTILCEFILLLMYLYGAQRYIFKESVLRGWTLNWKTLN